jgi:nitrous oxidase accessory protein NosD
VDSQGNSRVTGFFNLTATFGPLEANVTNLISDGFGDVFLAKFAGVSAASLIPVNCPAESLQAAINSAPAGSTITVSGTCAENLLIRNEKQRVTIDGGTVAVINAPNSSIPAFNVRGKGILIQNMTINGGSVGIYVNRGSNAVIHTNFIQNRAGHGVLVDELAFAVVTNNSIQNNAGAGVFVTEKSTARIGFNSDADSAASANSIQNNGVGVAISNNSSARVVGNTIGSNTGAGVQILRDSHADIASNDISGNADGIDVGENSFVQLGEDSGTNIFESPNTGANTGFGIMCADGGSADGRQGAITGNSGATSFDGSCINGLSP